MLELEPWSRYMILFHLSLLFIYYPYIPCHDVTLHCCLSLRLEKIWVDASTPVFQHTLSSVNQTDLACSFLFICLPIYALYPLFLELARRAWLYIFVDGLDEYWSSQVDTRR